VLEAGNAAQALAILDARADISLLFSDVGLPGMNGPELADTARANGRDLKVVFTSGYARTVTANLNLNNDMLILPKPFRIGSLARLLRTALDRN
jgi:CheY-like chemotaxis protein